MKRTPLRRRAPLTTGRRRKARKPSETQRVYGPPARRAWIRSLPCIECSASPCDNAHSIGGGVGRKADAETIVPLCRKHHRAYDEHRAPFDSENRRAFVKWHAVRIETLWQQRSGGPEHISSVVARVMEEL